ncbi:MAG: tetratricopeptide repeat protein [Vicinamibacterales bacterium]|nr:tetratricopeptide repeat protein [Vicinamibacterales bacterium]
MTHVALVVVLAAAGAAAGVVRASAGPVQPAEAVTASPQAPPPGAAVDRRADAYYQFMLGRRLENADDVPGAVAAFRRALELDPTSAVIRAELSTLYARQGRIAEALAEAKAGLEHDAQNAELHRLMGMIVAEGAHSDDESLAGTPAAQAAARAAIGHLERALTGATVDTAPGIRLALGRLGLQTKDYDKAIAALRQLLVDEPGFPQGVAMLAEAYNASGTRESAIDLLKDAADRDPDFHASLAKAYEEAERWDEAAAAYERAAAANPRDTDVKLHWALSLINAGGAGRVVRARDLLLDVTRTSPGHAWALYLLARAQRETDDLDGAERTARRLLVLSPTSVSGAHVLAQVLAERRAFADVIDTLAPMVDKLPPGRDADRALLLTHLGFAYRETNRLKDSVAAFDRAHRLSPADDAVVAYLGQALNQTRQFDKALALVRPRRVAQPGDIRLARVEADTLRGLGQVDAGAALLRAHLDRRPATAGPHQALADYYASAGRSEDAAGILKGAVAAFPDDVDVRFQYGAMLERQKQLADAERVFREVLAADPEHAPALNYLGYMLAERGERLAEALALVTRAVALEPHNAAYLDSLGWVYFKLGNLDEAEPRLRAAAAQLPRDSVVQDHWGDLLARRGQTAAAVEAWKRSLAGDGESIDRSAIERKISSATVRRPGP